MDEIFSYTRAQAIRDGVLIDVSVMAKEAGIKYPVALTMGVQEVLMAGLDVEGQDYDGRLWDLLSVFRVGAGRTTGDILYFAPLFIMSDGKLHSTKMWAKCGPGDTWDPVITIMLEGED